jgi:hypothetical protein
MANQPEMSAWILKSEWVKFSTNDKDQLQAVLNKHIADSHVHPETYAASRVFGAGIPPTAPMFKRAVANISKTKTWTIFLCPSKSSSGALVQSSDASDYIKSL